MTEKELQIAIFDLISLTSLKPSLIDVNLIPYKGKMIRSHATPGVGDIYIQGPDYRGFWIEVKLPGQRITEVQRRWGDEIERAGGSYNIAWCVSTALEACKWHCKEWGVVDPVLNDLFNQLEG